MSLAASRLCLLFSANVPEREKDCCLSSPHSGLNLAPVSRLRGTWEKLPSKYEKLFGDLQDLFDPSRNMAKYRNVLNNQNLQPPIIPLFPVIKKDLTFLHEGRKHKN